MQKFKVKLVGNRDVPVEGEIYREHWFIHDTLVHKRSKSKYTGAKSLTHVNTGLCLCHSYCAADLRRLVDILADDVGVDGSFARSDELTDDQRLKIREQVELVIHHPVFKSPHASCEDVQAV